MEQKDKKSQRGLLVVYTGGGKGKTTAALGMCVRAVGHNWNVCLIQFVKGTWNYGEREGLKRLAPNVELHIVGEGCVGILGDTKDFEEHRKAAEEGISLALEKTKCGRYQLIILDELNVAMKLGLVTEMQARSILDARNRAQNLVITGRDAPDWLKEIADLVTEMQEVKHPYREGILARKGVDW